MRVVNNKSYSSSHRFNRFVKYRMPIEEPTRNQRNEFDRLALLNLTEQSNIIYENIDDREVENIIHE
jgi:hypothetical protein